MGFFDFFRPKNINQGIEEYRKTQGAVLLDVRTPGEYSEGHIENSVNLPVQEIDGAGERLPDKNTALFVYCHSGVRSAHAARLLKKNGIRERQRHRRNPVLSRRNREMKDGTAGAQGRLCGRPEPYGV